MLESGKRSRSVAMRSSSPCVIGAVQLLALAPGLAQAQQEAQQAAERVVRAALAAHDSMQWSKLVLLIHPQALAQMHQSNLASVAGMSRAENRPPRRDPNLPECVAEWFAQQRAAAAERDPWGLPALGVRSVEEAARLSAEEFMARWLEAHDQRAMSRRSQAIMRAQVPDSMRGRGLRMPRLSELRDVRAVIGSVVENDSTIAVLYRPVVPAGLPGGDASVVNVRRSPDGWRLWPSGPQIFPASGGWMGYFGAPGLREEQEAIRQHVKRVVNWDATEIPGGRASLAGFLDSRDPQALIVESDGQRIRIPRSAFEALSNLLEIRHYAPRR
jgi:hypothetical protein